MTENQTDAGGLSRRCRARARSRAEPGHEVDALSEGRCCGFRRMTPDHVPERNGSCGRDREHSGDIGRAPRRMSPKRRVDMVGPGATIGSPVIGLRPAKLIGRRDGQVGTNTEDFRCQGGRRLRGIEEGEEGSGLPRSRSRRANEAHGTGARGRDRATPNAARDLSSLSRASSPGRRKTPTRHRTRRRDSFQVWVPQVSSGAVGKTRRPVAGSAPGSGTPNPRRRKLPPSLFPTWYEGSG